MPDYSEVVIETSNLIMKKAVFDDWEQLYRNITSRPESAKYMLWKIDDSEEESKDRMLRTLDFQSKEKYAFTVYLKLPTRRLQNVLRRKIHMKKTRSLL